MPRRGGIRAILFAAACFSAAIVHASLAPVVAEGQAGAPAKLSFNRDIRPILANNCFACHGPDEKQRETKFHFDTKEGAFLEDGDHRARATPPRACSSRGSPTPIRTSGCRRRNPGTRSPTAQIELLRRWIDEGREVGHALGLRGAVAAGAAAGRATRMGAQRRSIASSSRASSAKG